MIKTKMSRIFDSIRSVWLRCLQLRRNWLFRMNFLTVFAVCCLGAGHTKITGHVMNSFRSV
jgi:hypothetical protein